MRNNGGSPYKISSLTQRLSFCGVAIGLLFFNLSLTPSLLPRSWLLQGILSGLTTGIGYALGLIGWKLSRYFFKQKIKPNVRARSWRLLLILGGSLTCISYLQADNWQRDVRALMELPLSYSYHGLLMVITAVIIVVFLVGLFRVIRILTRGLSKLIDRFTHPYVARTLGIIFGAVLVIFVAQSILFHSWLNYINRVSSLTDRTTSPGIIQPSSSFLSGSPSSFVPWDSLGKAGRDFIGRTPTTEQLSVFSGQAAIEPIRVYIGLRSAQTLQEEADLAVQELERTEAFGRQVMVIFTSTGTGWVDPNAAEAIEYMYNGDSALVSMQYSYLPSWVSLLSDKATVTNASKILISTIEAKLDTLPPNNRPRLLIFGESLGVYGTEYTYENLTNLLQRTDGALFVGPPHGSPIWNDLTSKRDASTPVWQPTYASGQHVRFGVNANDANTLKNEWQQPRVLYLQQASDPVVWWTSDLLFHKPDWLKGERGPDVSKRMQYFPIVTFWQVTVDLLFASDMPFGHGHNYGAKLVDGWAAVAAPKDWTEDDTYRLRGLIESHVKL